MADHSFGNIALAILPQTAQGTINATIAGLTTSVNTAQGLVLGVGTTGEGNSGIELPEHTREGLALARIGKGRQADTFIRESASGLKITFPLGGARNTASNPTVDADFDLSQSAVFPGFDAILKATGLTGAGWTGGAGWDYVASGGVTYATVCIWAGGFKITYLDVLVSKLTFKTPPGEIGTVEAEFVTPSVYGFAAQSLATITQGNQATACPVVQGVGFAYGNTRPFESLEVALAPTTEESPDSNAANGKRSRQTAFDVDVKGMIYAATADADAERDTLISTSAPTTDATFQVGSATSAAGVANSYAFNLNNMTVRKTKMRKLGDYLGWESDLEGNCIASAGTEFTFRLL